MYNALYVYLKSDLMKSTKQFKFSYHISFFLANSHQDCSRTPILTAALTSNDQVSNAVLVEYLMDNGADITAVDDKGSIHI